MANINISKPKKVNRALSHFLNHKGSSFQLDKSHISIYMNIYLAFRNLRVSRFHV